MRAHIPKFSPATQRLKPGAFTYTKPIKRIPKDKIVKLQKLITCFLASMEDQPIAIVLQTG
jgi:hypothetical protein